LSVFGVRTLLIFTSVNLARRQKVGLAVRRMVSTQTLDGKLEAEVTAVHCAVAAEEIIRSAATQSEYTGLITRNGCVESKN